MTSTNYTLEEVQKELDERFVENISFEREDEFNWYFNYGIEQLKVRKNDCAVHFRKKGQSEWNYDFDLM